MAAFFTYFVEQWTRGYHILYHSHDVQNESVRVSHGRFYRWRIFDGPPYVCRTNNSIESTHKHFKDTFLPSKVPQGLIASVKASFNCIKTLPDNAEVKEVAEVGVCCVAVAKGLLKMR
jgi:hypothetical protein